MTILLPLLLLLAPPLHPAPRWTAGYLPRLARESELVQSYLRHRDEPDVARAVLGDGQVPVAARQRLWQAMRKENVR